MTRLRISWSSEGALVVTIVAAIVISSLWRYWDGGSFYRPIDIRFNRPQDRLLETTIHFSRTGNFETETFKWLRDELLLLAKQSGGECFYQDAFGVGKDGALYPKHAPLVAVLAAPWYLALGFLGIWLLEVCSVSLLIFGGAHLFTTASQYRERWLFTLCILLFSEVPGYGVELSYDAIGAALIVGGAALLRRAPFWGACALLLSCGVRPAHALLLFPLLLTVNQGASRAFLGALFGALPTLYLNTLFWGHPFDTAYNHLVKVCSDGLVHAPHAFGFNIQVLLSEWHAKLLGGQNGWVLYNPFVLLAPFVLVWGSRDRVRARQENLMLIMTAAYALYIFSYEWWATSGRGNRFLLPVTVVWYALAARVLVRSFLSYRKKTCLQGTAAD